MEASKLILCIETRDICYLQWIIESYDGMANMRTTDPIRGEVEISIAPGCREEVNLLINRLKNDGSIHVR